MKILVIGANGFIGSKVSAALAGAGHTVVHGVRRTRLPVADQLATVGCDFARDQDPENWLPKLHGVDAVVNCAGILREKRGGDFDAAHIRGPQALYQACIQAGVRKVIQVSALGDKHDSRFIATKYAGDEALMSLDLDWVILRPSVVYSVTGSYGGTSLIRAMAAFPALLAVPGSGQQQLQPVSGEDLARVVLAVLVNARCRRKVLEVVGPTPITFHDFLLAWRRWLGFAEPLLELRVPLIAVRALASLGEWFGKGPLGLTMYRMLQRGNVGLLGSYETLVRTTGVETRSLAQELALYPSYVQDRWHARLYPLRPILRIALAFVWVLSGVAGFVIPLSESQAVAGMLGISGPYDVMLVYGASILDVALGLVLLSGRLVIPTGLLMLLSLVAYTLLLGIFMPMAWLDPFGGLLKNIALIPAVLIMLVMERVR